MLKHIKEQQDWEEQSLGAKGFTLIELLVVIVILGILAAVVIFAVSGITNRGQKSACSADASTVRTAVEAFEANTGNYPTTTAQLASGGYLQSDNGYITLAGGGGTVEPGYTWSATITGGGANPCTGQPGP